VPSLLQAQSAPAGKRKAPARARAQSGKTRHARLQRVRNLFYALAPWTRLPSPRFTPAMAAAG
jgi:hypothetical protein